MIHSMCEWASDVWCLASCFNNSLLFQTINLSGRCEPGTDQWWCGVTWDEERRRWGHRLTLVTPHSLTLLSGFHSLLCREDHKFPGPGPVWLTPVQTLGGCSVSGAEWPGPISQSEAAILASGPIRGGHSPPYWQRETGVSVPCRDQWAAGPASPEVSQYQARHNTGRLSPITYHKKYRSYQHMQTTQQPAV